MKLVKEKGLKCATLVFAVILALGSVYVFHACGKTDDDMWMACHWAQHAVTALGVLLSVMSAANVLIPPEKGYSRGLSLAVTATAVLTAIVPGYVISLCMMDTMRCHTVMRPAVVIISVIIAALSLADVVLARKSYEKL